MEAGIFAEKLVNNSGLEDVTTWACVLKEMVSNKHNANNLDMVFMVWNFGFQLYRTIIKRYSCIKIILILKKIPINLNKRKSTRKDWY